MPTQRLAADRPGPHFGSQLRPASDAIASRTRGAIASRARTAMQPTAPPAVPAKRPAPAAAPPRKAPKLDDDPYGAEAMAAMKGTEASTARPVLSLSKRMHGCREACVRWMLGVSKQLRLERETLHLSVHLVDRALARSLGAAVDLASLRTDKPVSLIELRLTDSTDPRERERNVRQSRHFRAGGYSAADALGDWNATRLMGRILRRIGSPNATLIRGYYNESLTDALMLRQRFQPALLVDLDCDLYVSTMDAFRWLLRHHLLVPTSIVRYDDWGRSETGSPQATAHSHVSKRWGLEWRLLDVTRSARAFQLLSVAA